MVIITSCLNIQQCLRLMTVISYFLLSPLTTENKSFISTHASRWCADDAGWQSANDPPLHVYSPYISCVGFQNSVYYVVFLLWNMFPSSLSFSERSAPSHHTLLYFLWPPPPQKCTCHSVLVFERQFSFTLPACFVTLSGLYLLYDIMQSSLQHMVWELRAGQVVENPLKEASVVSNKARTTCARFKELPLLCLSLLPRYREK